MIIPSLPKQPVLGNLHAWRHDRLALLQAAATYQPISAFHLGSWPVLLINDPDLVEQLLVTDSAAVEKSPMLRRHLQPILGDGLLTSTNATNQRHKRIMGSVFTPTALSTMLTPIIEYTRATMATWHTGQQINLSATFTNLTLAIIGQLLFDTPIAYTTDPALTWALSELNRYANLKTMDLIDLPLWLPLPRHRRLNKALAILDRRITHLIEQAPGSSTNPHLLNLLLAARSDTGDGLTLREIRDELATFFLAGHETTAVALQWLFSLLAQHPHIVQRLRIELADRLKGAAPQSGDLSHLPYLRATIQEVLRLYPPVYILARSAQRSMQLGPYTIAPNTSLAVSPYTLHRRADIYPEPEQFIPERWLDRPVPPRSTYIPFGAGPRQCIGKQIAMMELMLITATILPEFDIIIEQIPQPEPMLTLRPQGSVYAMVYKARE